MGKGLETGKGNDKFIPDDDYEFEKNAAEEARKKREALEEKHRLQEEAKLKKEREERKARERQNAQDKLDLMKMKAGIADEDEQIKEEHYEQRELHGWEKIENIWYHNKLWIILGAFFIGIIVFMIIDKVRSVDPDVEIMVICDNVLQNDETLNLIADKIAEYTPDINGDGQVKVSVIGCALNPEKYDMMYSANSQKFYANIQLGEIIMFITDSYTDPDLQALMSTDLPDRLPDNPYINQNGLSLDFKFLAEEINCPDMPDDVYLCLRTPIDPLSGSKEKMQKNYDDCYEVFAAFANALAERAKETGDPGLSNEPVTDVSSN